MSPRGFFNTKTATGKVKAQNFVTDLRQYFDDLRPMKTATHGGHYLVIYIDRKTVVLRLQGQEVMISMDCVKPAYVIAEDWNNADEATSTTFHPHLRSPQMFLNKMNLSGNSHSLDNPSIVQDSVSK